MSQSKVETMEINIVENGYTLSAYKFIEATTGEKIWIFNSVEALTNKIKELLGTIDKE